MESVKGIIASRVNGLTGFSNQLNFQANSLNTGFYTAENTGQITSVEISNVNSFTITRNGSLVTVPFLQTRGDVIAVTITRLNSAAAASLRLVAQAHSQATTSRTIFSQDTGTGRYIYCLNHRDQTVSVIDTDTDIVIATVSLPAGNDWFAMCYRIVNQSIYLFGKNGTNTPACRIDADPASGTFNSVFSLTGVLNGTTNVLTALGFNSIISAVYDYINDLIYFSDGSNGGLLNPVTNVGSNINSVTALAGYGLFFNESNNTIVSPEAAFVISLFSATTTKNTFTKSASTLGVTGIFNKKNGLSYLVGNAVRVFNNSLTSVATLTMALNWGDLALDLDDDLLMVAHSYDGKNYVYNTATNALIGSWTRGSLGTDETAARGCVYSPYSGKFYVQASGTTNLNGINRVHIYDPAVWIADGSNPANLSLMDVGFITVGNLHSGSGSGINRYDHMCANVLI